MFFCFCPSKLGPIPLVSWVLGFDTPMASNCAIKIFIEQHGNMFILFFKNLSSSILVKHGDYVVCVDDTLYWLHGVNTLSFG